MDKQQKKKYNKYGKLLGKQKPIGSFSKKAVTDESVGAGDLIISASCSEKSGPSFDERPNAHVFFWKSRLVAVADEDKIEIPCPDYKEIPVYTNEEEPAEENGSDFDKMTEIVGVRFRSTGKVYYFLPGESKDSFVKTKSGDNVIVNTARGIEFGTVFVPNKMIENVKLEKLQPMRCIVRLATDEDIKTHAENSAVEKKGESVFIERVTAHGLPMKLIDIQYTFDRSKLLFFFSSEGRVDFRELVKDLAAVFHTRIELRQIGIRDEARIMGGLGACGRPLCCSSFLTDFMQVSIKMAKSQIMSLNPTKISGCCGRLMCCLRYENDTYEAEIAKTPPVESVVLTPNGYGIVTEIHPLAETVKVKLTEKTDVQFITCHRDNVKIVSAIDSEYLASVGRAAKQFSEKSARSVTSHQATSNNTLTVNTKQQRTFAPTTMISSNNLFTDEVSESEPSVPKVDTASMTQSNEENEKSRNNARNPQKPQQKRPNRNQKGRDTGIGDSSETPKNQAVGTPTSNNQGRNNSGRAGQPKGARPAQGQGNDIKTKKAPSPNVSSSVAEGTESRASGNQGNSGNTKNNQGRNSRQRRNVPHTLPAEGTGATTPQVKQQPSQSSGDGKNPNSRKGREKSQKQGNPMVQNPTVGKQGKGQKSDNAEAKQGKTAPAEGTTTPRPKQNHYRSKFYKGASKQNTDGKNGNSKKDTPPTP